MRGAEVQLTAAESEVVAGLSTLNAIETRALGEVVRTIVTTPVAVKTPAPRNTHTAAPPQAAPSISNRSSVTAPDAVAGQRSDVGASATALDPRAAAIIGIGRAGLVLAAIPAFVAFDLGVTAGQVILDLAFNVGDVVPDLVAGLKLTVALNSSLFQSETQALADSIHELYTPTSVAPNVPAVAAMKSAARADALAARVHVAVGEQTAPKRLRLHVVKGATQTGPVADTNADTKDDKASGTEPNTKADNGSVTKSQPAAGIASRIRHAFGQATQPADGAHRAAADAHTHGAPAGAKADKKSSGKRKTKHTA
jgi:hypothetical protein